MAPPASIAAGDVIATYAPDYDDAAFWLCRCDKAASGGTCELSWLELLEDELPIGPWSGPLMPSLEIVAVEEAEPGALPPPREVKHLMPRLGLA